MRAIITLEIPEGRPMSFMVEIIPQSMSTDVKVSVIDDPDNYIKTRGVTSIGIDTTFTNFLVGDVIAIPYFSEMFFKIDTIESNGTMSLTGSVWDVSANDIKYYSIDYTMDKNSYYKNNINSEDPNYMYEITTFGEAIDNDGAFSNYIGDHSNGFINDGYGDFLLANNVFLDGVYSNNKFGNNCYNNTFDDDCTNNTIGNWFHNNITDDDFNNNQIQNGFSNNTLGNDFSNNQIGNNFNNNQIGENFGSSAGSAQGNKIGNNFDSNNIGEYFYNNSIPDNFYNNQIGNFFQWNEINTNINDTNFTLNYGNITGFTYTSTGTGASSSTYTGLTGSVSGGPGSGASFDVIVSGGTASSVTLNSTGSSNQYSINDTITILGTAIGGVTGVDDVVITITDVTSSLFYDHYTKQIFERRLGDKRVSFYDEDDILNVDSIYISSGYIPIYSQSLIFPINNVYFEFRCDGVHSNDGGGTGLPVYNVHELVTLFNSSFRQFGYFFDNNDGTLGIYIDPLLKEQYCPIGTYSIYVDND